MMYFWLYIWHLLRYWGPVGSPGTPPHHRATGGWLERIARGAADSRGMTMLIALFVLFGIGMMLFGFAFLSEGEVGNASFNRNSIEAFDLAEAGVQEALNRLTTAAVSPGVTTFQNSLATSSFSPNSTGTVTYQATVQGLSSYFPILSTATFNGAQRAVRVLERAVYKVAPGNVIFGPQVVFQGDASPITGDEYSLSNVLFATYKKSPLCASGATATNLVSPQVFAGTTISAGAGSNVTPPCGAPVNFTALAVAECVDGSLTEVAPTSCTGHGGRTVDGSANLLPVNWHPMTPIGMPSADFTTVVQAVQAGTAPVGLAWVQATQNGTGVTYGANSYTPAYWSSIPATSGKVILITATQPFCVSAGAGTVTLPSPPITGTCAAGIYYGNQVSGSAVVTRFLDWSLVTDDLGRGAGVPSTTFFQPAGCATCGGGGSGSIRYIPVMPLINVLPYACSQNVASPGTNVFDKVNGGDGISCASPPTTTISSTSVTVTGTKSAPESLVIDNAGLGTVQIYGSLGNGGSDCASNFNNANWGIILATGDVDLQNNFFFSGFIYTPGNVISHGTVVMQGGIYAANTAGSSSEVTHVDTLGNVKYCAGSMATVPISSMFFTFRTVSWQDRPLNRP